MRKSTFIIVAFTVSLALGSSPGAAQEKATKFVPKELLVKFKINTDEKTQKEIRKIGAKLLEKLTKIDVSRLSLPKGITVKRAMALMQKLDIVAYAEPNYVQRAVGWINDPRYDEQWSLENVRALKGWGTHTGRSQTVIAIVDTGVDLDHPDLKRKIVPGYDFVDGDDQADDVGGHGTHCAGIAAATANNNIGVVGVCPNCSIMPVRVLSADGGSASNVAKGIVWAADHGADVISLSLGAYTLSSTIEDAVAYARSKNVVLVAAAGNNNTQAPHYPAYLDECIAVGSIDRNNHRSSFSNYGDWVDVAAPGGYIVSTVPDDTYGTKSGTSMAAPLVAGLAGLMTTCPGATPDRVREAILTGVIDTGDWVQRGRVDVPSALEALGCRKADSTSGGASGSGTSGGSSGGAAAGSSGGTRGGDSAAGGAGTGGGSPETPTVFNGTSHVVNHGNTLKTPGNALSASDDSRLALSSKGSGFSTIIDVYMTTKISTSDPIESMDVALEAYTDNPGTFTLYLYNWKSNEWNWLGQPRIEDRDKRYSFNRAGPATYISGGGEVRLKVYRKEKIWNAFKLNTDHVQITITPKKPEPKKEEDKSLGDKTRDAWRNLKKKF